MDRKGETWPPTHFKPVTLPESPAGGQSVPIPPVSHPLAAFLLPPSRMLAFGLHRLHGGASFPFNKNIIYLFIYLGCTPGIWKFRGQRSNLCLCSKPGCCSDNARSFTCCAAAETPLLLFFQLFLLLRETDIGVLGCLSGSRLGVVTALAQIWSLAWELSHALGIAKKEKKEKKKKKKKERDTGPPQNECRTQ